jgi:hypothetical protein
MGRRTRRSLFVAALLLVFGVSVGCESTDGGGSYASGSVYYGVGFYDPWYYGGYHGDVDVIVPPPDYPGTPNRPVRPEQPIARPPAGPTVRPTPRPSIPSSPRPAARPAGRR